MVKLFKYVSFWLTLFALAVSLFNLFGFDDKNLLLYLTNPLLWFSQDFLYFLKRFISEQFLTFLLYLLSLFFWCYVGLVFDAFVHASKRKKIGLHLFRIGIASCVVVLISVVFYTVQNTEKHICAILKQPHTFNDYSVQTAVVQSAKDGYGENYIEEMAAILQTTTSKEIYGSTLYALGIIGTPVAIQTLIEYYEDPLDVLYPLQRNEHIILSMLDKNQAKPIIAAGIEAAKLLNFTSFIDPLDDIANHYPDQDIQASAKEVLEQIKQNPKINNPKFNID